MRISRETHTESIMKLLEKLKLSPEHLNLLENYLAGDKGEEVLMDLPYQNLNSMKMPLPFMQRMPVFISTVFLRESNRS